MSDFQTIARPYAKAAFALANDTNQLDQWSEFLAFTALTVSNEEMAGFLSNPRSLSKDKAAFIIDVLKAGLSADKVNEAQCGFIRLLAENSRLSACDDILEQYEALKREVDGVVEVKVVSAQELTSDQSKAMAEKLKARFGKDVTISAEVDETLLAGAVIYADDVVIDGTARGKLDKLSTVLNR